MLEAKELFGRFLHEGFDSILVAEPVTTRDGVVGVLVEAVVRCDGAAAPPSAETVWLRIGYTLETTATFSLGLVSAMAIAARRPAPPPPTSTTS